MWLCHCNRNKCYFKSAPLFIASSHSFRKNYLSFWYYVHIHTHTHTCHLYGGVYCIIRRLWTGKRWEMWEQVNRASCHVCNVYVCMYECVCTWFSDEIKQNGQRIEKWQFYEKRETACHFDPINEFQFQNVTFNFCYTFYSANNQIHPQITKQKEWKFHFLVRSFARFLSLLRLAASEKVHYGISMWLNDGENFTFC